MFGIGGFEFLVILLFAFLIFGPDKLPEIARTAGELIGRFKQAQDEMNNVVRSELLDEKNQKSKTRPSSTRKPATAKPAPAAGKPAASEKKDEDIDVASGVGSRVVEAVDNVTASAKESAHEQRVQKSQATETFSERRARYERERLEANRQAMKDAAAEPVDAAPMPTAAELYGTKPAKPKPAAKPVPSQPSATEHVESSSQVGTAKSAPAPASSVVEASQKGGE